MLSFFPRDVLNEILDLIASVAEGSPTYSFINFKGSVSFLYSSVSNVRSAPLFSEMHNIAADRNFCVWLFVRFSR